VLLLGLHLFAGIPLILFACYVLVVVVVVLAAGIVSWIRGNAAARYYMIAWGFMLAGVFVAMLGLLGAIPQPVGARALQFGSAFQVTLLSLGLGYRYNAMRKTREQMRLRIASDLHDDIGSGLTLINLQSEQIRRMATGDAAAVAGQVGVLARSLASEMQDIVWAIKPEDETWEGLALRMKDHAARLLGPTAIAFEMEGTQEYVHEELPVEVRQNVMRMFKEMLHNAVRHAACKTITVRWRLTRRSLRLQVCDDGCGFDPAQVRSGNGLRNLRRRAEQLHATFVLDTGPGHPTCYEVDIPLGADNGPYWNG
jgi:signal transduction histidine kinase